MYQLLPIYPCVEQPGGALARVTEVPGLPGVDAAKAAAALAFHHAIRDAVESHRGDAAYRDGGYRIRPIAGIFQPTSQSARVQADGVELLRSYEGQDREATAPCRACPPRRWS